MSRQRRGPPHRSQRRPGLAPPKAKRPSRTRPSRCPRKSRTAVAEGEEVEEAGDLDELLGEEGEGVEAEAEAEEVGEPAAVAAPAEWGILPAAVMIPCVLIMFFVGLMSFELLHSMWGYQKP